MADFEVDYKDIEKFFKKLSRAAKGDFKEQIATWFDALGVDFLKVVQDEIIRKEVVDTRLLLNSFTKGGKDNVWTVSDGGLTLEVGTNVKYAKWANDGHKQQPGRFIPGDWQGNKFKYNPGSKTGMVLKASFVEGKHYWESAIKIFEPIFEKSLEKKTEEWLERYIL